MATVIEIDDDLLAEVQNAAKRSGKSLNALVEDALRAALARQTTKEPVHLPTFKGGGGLQPGVDLDDHSALQDLMDGLDPL